MRTSFAVAASALAYTSNAFWGTAHLLVARQAQAILEAEDPAALSAAIDMFYPLKHYYSSLTTDEGDHPFTECATFADNIKGEGYSFQSEWHFINLPYFDEGGDADSWDYTMPDYDVVGALTDLSGFLKGTVSESDSYYVQQIADRFSYTEDQQSFALRMIIHYVGDIHQPLHAVAEVDSTYPNGDAGGNYEHIPSEDGVSNLHSVWDSAIYEWTGYPDLPLDDTDWDWYTTTAADLYTTYPVDTSMYKNNQFSDWATEDVEIAQDDVYAGFVEGEIPSQDYQTKAQEIIKYRMMVGSRRLAETIKDIFGSSTQLFLQ